MIDTTFSAAATLARMTLNIAVGTRSFTPVALAVLLGLIAEQAMAQRIEGIATYRERMARPTGAVFEATLEDVSRADAPEVTIARSASRQWAIRPWRSPSPMSWQGFCLIQEHVGRARMILLDDKLLFTTNTATPVITRSSPTSVSMTLRRVGAGQTAPDNPGPSTPSASNRSLETTYWKAIELEGKPTPAQNANREAHLAFQAGGRLSGSDGCNRITGSYERKGDGITFGQMAGTQMACIITTEIERAFRDALKGATRLTIVGDRLELFDVTGKRVAAFTARAQTSPPSTSPGLEGTSWQLVKFQGGDDTTLTPDDGAKYTIEFDAGGRLTARIDCNRGRGTWKSSGSNQLQFGPLALTRAKCPPGSLHDQIVKQWGYIRSYVIKDGRLFLSLMADGGIYEFEPVQKAKQ